MIPGRKLGPGREFDRIHGFLAGLSEQKGVRVGPGDDAAVLEEGWILSSDLAVEGVHFRLDWISPAEAGGRAVRAALSDLAAMAALPRGALVSLAVPPKTDPGSFVGGIRGVLEELEVPLLGGDLSRSPGPVVLDVTVLGQEEDPLLRSGARVGDELWVTGRLGAAAAAVRAWESGGQPEAGARRSFVSPPARIPEARWLRQRGLLHAGLDLSDGLAGDSGHLAAASAVQVVLLAPAIPIHGAAGRVTPPEGGDPGRLHGLSLALHGGEDYELLLVAPSGRMEPRVEEFVRTFDLSLTRIGEIRAGEGVWLQMEETGSPVRVERGGWDHFREESDAPGAPGGSGKRSG